MHTIIYTMGGATTGKPQVGTIQNYATLSVSRVKNKIKGPVRIQSIPSKRARVYKNKETSNHPTEQKYSSAIVLNAFKKGPISVPNTCTSTYGSIIYISA